jgi:integrase
LQTNGDLLRLGAVDIGELGHRCGFSMAAKAMRSAPGKPDRNAGSCHRHTFASLMIAAGANIKARSTYMGHASITITLDRYGHLMLGNEDEAARLLDSYLARECIVQSS